MVVYPGRVCTGAWDFLQASSPYWAIRARVIALSRYIAPLIVLALAVIFWFDLYPWPTRMFEPALELRFLSALSGLFLFTVGQDYAFRVARARSVERQRLPVVPPQPSTTHIPA